MYHPVFLDPTSLRDSDIESKILELSRKYNMVMSMGKDDLGEQIVLIIDQLKQEQDTRRRKKLEKANSVDINGLVKTF